jgi:hypothetical protein
MNFVADANISRQVIERLREEGHVVDAVFEIGPEMAEREILEMVNRRSAIVFTADTTSAILYSTKLNQVSASFWFVSGSFPLTRGQKSL